MISTQTTPAYQDPEMVAGAHHQNWLAHVMSTVGSILGGDTTLHVTKHPDGSVEVTHDPSTEGEKWGRVAAAALGGASRGLAVGQGPGGPARAAAAGTQYGLQQPQQRIDEANQEATAEQERMRQNANNAILHQRAYQEMLTSRELKTNVDKQSADLLNSYRDDLASSPNAKDFGVITNFDDLNKTAQQNADFLHAHTDLTLKAALVPTKDGMELHAIATDPGDDAAVAPDGAQLHTIKVDPKTGEPTLTATNAARGTKNGQLRLANQAMDIQYANLRNNWTKTNKPAPAPKTPAEMRLAAGTEPDPVKKQALLTAANEAENTPAIKAQIAAHEAAATASRAEAGLHEAQTEALKGNTPGGTPQPVNDPNFPPAANFDKNTEGINPMPKGGYKIPADTQKAARLSRNIQHNGNVIVDIMNRRPDLVGTVNSLGTNWQTKIVGTNDKDLAALSGAVDQLAIASAGAHGSRAAKLVEGIHDGVLNHFKNGPDAIKAYTQGQMSSVQTFIDEENNYRHYGDPVGPSTADRARAVAKAPPAPGAPAAAAAAPAATAAPNVDQAARAPGAPPTPPPIDKVPLGHDTTFANGQIWRNDHGTLKFVGNAPKASK
jgi:hypothetical protein